MNFSIDGILIWYTFYMNLESWDSAGMDPVEKGEVERERELFYIPDTRADIEDKICELREKLEADKENQTKKANAPLSGVPEEALPDRVKSADQLYQVHLRQLELLKEAKKKAA